MVHEPWNKLKMLSYSQVESCTLPTNWETPNFALQYHFDTFLSTVEISGDKLIGNSSTQNYTDFRLNASILT